MKFKVRYVLQVDNSDLDELTWTVEWSHQVLLSRAQKSSATTNNILHSSFIIDHLIIN